MTTPLPRVLVAAQDPGGAQAVAPVARHLNRDGRVEVLSLGVRWARAVFRDAGLPEPAWNPAPDPAGWDAMLAVARAHVQESAPDALLVGTSWGPSIDKALIAAARDRHIPSLAVLDSWTYYVERFSGPRGEDRLAYLPDAVAVMDAYAIEEMIAEGIPRDRLVVTGHPAFDSLVEDDGGRDALRLRLAQAAGVPETAAIVLFASEPLRSFYGSTGAATRERGYDELQVLAGVAAAVEALHGQVARPVILAIKPHPKEDPGPLWDALPASRSGFLLTDDPVLRLLRAADAVVGMTSIVLVQSYLLGRPTISYQPSRRGRDLCILTRAGLLPPVADRSALGEALRLALDGRWTTGSRRNGLLSPGGAGARVVAEIYRLMGITTPTVVEANR